MSNSSRFKKISGITASDQQINHVAEQQGVPSLHQTVNPRVDQKPKNKRLTVELPDYVIRQIKDLAYQDDVVIRYMVLALLKDAGLTVNDEDLIKDGRRGK